MNDIAEKPVEYCGMRGVVKKKQRSAVDFLIFNLRRIADWPEEKGEVAVYGEYDSVKRSNGQKMDYWRVIEISFHTASGGSAIQNCIPEAIGLLAASQLVLETAHFTQANLDERASTVWLLEKIWKLGETK